MVHSDTVCGKCHLPCCCFQNRERNTFDITYEPPKENANILKRSRYNFILTKLRDAERRENDSDVSSDDGFSCRERDKVKDLQRKWHRKVLLGGTEQLCRKYGPMPDVFHAQNARYPVAVCEDELFDILWKIHHESGHLKTPAALHNLTVRAGYWGIPRTACQKFVACCLICMRSKRILHKVIHFLLLFAFSPIHVILPGQDQTCTPIYAAKFMDRMQMDLIGRDALQM